MRKIVYYSGLLMLLVAITFACGGKQEAEYRMGSIPNDELIQLMNKDKTTEHFIATVAIERGAEALPHLLSIFDHGDKISRRNLREVIGSGKLKDPEAVSMLIEFFESREWEGYWTRNLDRLLKEYSDQATGPLLIALQQTTGDVRLGVIKALGRMDNPQVGQALQKISYNKDDPYWKQAVALLAERRDDSGKYILELAHSDMDVREIVCRKLSWHLEPIDSKELLPFYFRLVQSEDRSLRWYARWGIARNAGKAELPRIEAEFAESDRTWILPFMEINCAVEGVESKSENGYLNHQCSILALTTVS